jgi:Nif-specific regulatory protein
VASDRRLDDVALERDLYRRLLDVWLHDEPKALLVDALALMVELTDARRGFLAIFGDEQETPRWWLASGFSDSELKAIMKTISSGIISEVLTSGQPIVRASAVDDPRLSLEHESISRNQIQAVMCLPIGATAGVVYLQDHIDGGSFTEFRTRARAALRAPPRPDRRSRPPARQQDRRSHCAVPNTAPARPPRRPQPRARRRVRASRGRGALLGARPHHRRFRNRQDLLARAIHDNGPRAAQPFLELNCAAIPETLFESELFGALPGAHSTATRKMAGKIAAAQGGTLFLDEIGELPLAVQSKLLQFLQSREYFPLGAVSPEKANVRIIAATNHDLRAQVEAKRFREDLFYRLNVLAIAMPTLAERNEDIELLARAVCASACASNELPPMTLSPSAVMAIEAAEWPGNVRQLAHAVEAATIRAAMTRSSSIEQQHLFPEDATTTAPARAALTFQEATRRFQARLLRETLDAAEWNISETARRMDLTRTHVRHLIRAFG